MELIDATEPKVEDRSDLVKRLVVEAFGKGSRADMSIEDGWYYGWSSLENITVKRRSTIFGIPMPWIGTYWVGQFLDGRAGRRSNQDGHYIKVQPKYRKEAIRYAELFEKATGQNATVEISENFYY